MLVDYRCREGHVEEHLVPRGQASPRTCIRCGADSTRMYSGFAIKQWKVDRSNFADVAPLGADGKPMTLKEASKVGDRYTPGEADRERSRLRAQDAEREAGLLEAAKREAWNEISGRRRITVRG